MNLIFSLILNENENGDDREVKNFLVSGHIYITSNIYKSFKNV